MKPSTSRYLNLASLLCAVGLLTHASLVVPAAAATPAPAVVNPSEPSKATGTEADAAVSASKEADADAKTDHWDRSESADTDTDTDADTDADSDSEDDVPGRDARRKHRHAGGHGNELVNFGDDSVLDAGKKAYSVVSVCGDARVAGTVDDGVVAVFGDARVDGTIGGDVVAVFGNVELGPHAKIDGDVVSVFGKVRRDPSAVVRGDVHSVFAHDVSAPSGLRAWIDQCLKYGRPLSLTQGLGWAWGLALSLLALYAAIALLFGDAVARCATTLERQPTQSVLAALLAVLLTPVLIVLLCITIVGIAAVPFVVIGLACVVLFAKTVALAWIGRRILLLGGAEAATRVGANPALAVLLGGLVALALYLVPIVGFIVYKLLGLIGLGAVVYSAVLALQARQAAKNGADTRPQSAGAASVQASTVVNAEPAAVPRATTDLATEGIASPQMEQRASATAGAAAEPLLAVDPAKAVLPHAGFWIRMAALLIDILLVGVVTSFLHVVSHGHLVLLAAYGAIMWKLRGCTVGGIVFDLRVVRVDGREMDWQTSIIRALSCFLSLAAAGLGFFWIGIDDANQAWHDKIAGTYVVRIPKLEPRPAV